MPSPNEFPPYEGRVTWSPMKQQWTVQVRHADGGLIPAQEFFQAVVLAYHLRRAGVPQAAASNESNGYACLVWRSNTGDLGNKGDVLLRVLKARYSQFKGRSVNWTLAAR